jgi:hypothetical protein
MISLRNAESIRLHRDMIIKMIIFFLNVFVSFCNSFWDIFLNIIVLIETKVYATIKIINEGIIKLLSLMR